MQVQELQKQEEVNILLMDCWETYNILILLFFCDP